MTTVGETEFAHFSIDLALPRDDIGVEWIEPQTLVTGEAAVDNIPRVATLTFPAQLADKVCALYERHGEGAEHSSRARDLADIAMIASQVDIDGTELAGRVRAEEQRRRVAGTLTEPFPNTLTLPPVQQYDWSRRWTKATRGAPITFEDALVLASALMDPILDGRAADARWDATQRAWSHR